MTETQRRALRAAVDRIIPADEFASGSGAGVDTHVAAALATYAAADAAMVLAFLDAADAEGRSRFGGVLAELSDALADTILLEAEHGLWQGAYEVDGRRAFGRLVSLCAEAYYTSEAGLRMVGWPASSEKTVSDAGPDSLRR